MLSVFSVTLPFFALVLCGFLATRWRAVPVAAIGGLNTFVLYFALPCLLYRFGARAPLAQLLDLSAAVVYFLCMLLLVGPMVALLRGRWGWNDASFAALVTVFPNSGFMGVPLLLAFAGERSAATVILTIAIDMCLTSTLCVVLSCLGTGGARGGMQALRQALRGMAANPMPIAIVLGGLASAWQWQLWAPVDQTVAMLADAASPVALFTIGAVLARSQLNRQERLVVGEVMPLALAKLVLHPLLVLGVGRVAMAAGLALDGFTLTVLVLVAALPSASNVVMLVERLGGNSSRVAHIIMATTALAFVTFSAAVVLLL